jgi:anti-anti-sigma factor
MATGFGHALTDQDEGAARWAAIAAARRDAAIELSCQISADGHATVAVRGDLDLATVDQVVRYVSDVIDRHDGLVSADVGGVTFCDACGLGALIRIAAYAERAGRQLELVRPSRAVTRIMRITGIDHLIAPSALERSAGVPHAAAARA